MKLYKEIFFSISTVKSLKNIMFFKYKIMHVYNIFKYEICSQIDMALDVDPRYTMGLDYYYFFFVKNDV